MNTSNGTRRLRRFKALAGILGLGFVSCTAVAHLPGAVDPSFNATVGTDEWVSSCVVQNDGKVVMVGYFSRVNGLARTNIARLDRNGAVDPGFDCGSGANDLVNAVVLQGNQIVIAGYFTQVNGTNQGRLARLNADGGLDTTFIGANLGANGPVLTLAVQDDGKVLLGGSFTSVNGVGRTNLARLNANGNLDTEFTPGPVTGGSVPVVNVLALQPDGKVIVGGTFSHLNGTPRQNLARLNSDGSVDSSFSPAVDLTGATVLAGVCAAAVCDSGKIMIAGDFTSVSGTPRTNIARLNNNGSLDTSFDPGPGTDAPISALAVQSDGEVVIGGYFGRVNGISRTNLARLMLWGAVDASFATDSGPDNAVYATTLQPDGNLIVGGLFSSLGGTPRRGIARFYINSGVSRPQLFNPVFGNNSFQVSLETEAGRSYTLEFKTAMSDTIWTSLGAVTGDGTVKTLIDPAAETTARFYRVRVE